MNDKVTPLAATVALSDLRRICDLYPRLRRAPTGARSLNLSPMRRLRVLTIAAGGGYLMVESATMRETVSATGILDAVTVDARILGRALELHSAERVELENVGSLRVTSGRFSTTTPAA